MPAAATSSSEVSTMVTLTSVGASSTTTITTTVTVTSMPASTTQENDRKTTAALPASTTSSSEGNGFCQASRAPPGRRTDSLPNVIANIEDREWNQELLPTDGPILGLPDLLGTLDAAATSEQVHPERVYVDEEIRVAADEASVTDPDTRSETSSKAEALKSTRGINRRIRRPREFKPGSGREQSGSVR